MLACCWFTLSAAPVSAWAAPFDSLDALSTVRVGCPWTPDQEEQNRDTGYRDAKAVYFTAQLPVDPGPDTYYEIEGRFPKARYFSFQTYDGVRIGNFIDSLPDARVPPLGLDPAMTAVPTLPANPAVLPDSGGYTYTYKLRMVYDNPPARDADRAPGTLYARRGTQRGAVVKQLGYRVYLPNPGARATGDVGLPTITYVGPLGRIQLENTPDTNACASARASASATGGTPGLSSGKRRPAFQALDGSFVVYPNGDAYYLQADVSTRYGEMIVVRAKAPVVPLLPPLLEANPDVRYWSACHYDLRTSNIASCVSDRDAVLQADGYYTFVMSPPDKRPATATAAAGYNWMVWGASTEGRFGLRQILPSADFAGNYARARAAPLKPLDQTLGEWAPQISYCDVTTFDAVSGQGGEALMAACKLASAQPVFTLPGLLR